MGKTELGGGLIQQEAFLPVALGRLVAHADRHLPDLPGIARGADRQVAFLGERERRGAAAVEVTEISGKPGCSRKVEKARVSCGWPVAAIASRKSLTRAFL